MSGRESLLAELEAQRREQAEINAQDRDSDFVPDLDGFGYDPYDNPGHAKPLDVERSKKKLKYFRRR